MSYSDLAEVLTLRPLSLAAAQGLLVMPAPQRRVLGRFMEHVVAEDRGFTTPCWVWTGQLEDKGYGRFWDGESNRTAHRWIFEQIYGPVPLGLQLHHRCEVEPCAHPEHVEPLTALEHNRLTHPPVERCPSGHAYDEKNTRWYQGRRYCRECNRNGGAGRTTTGSRPRGAS